MEHTRGTEHVKLKDEDVVELIEGLDRFQHSYGVYPYSHMTREERRHAMNEITSVTHKATIRDRKDLDNANVSKEQRKLGVQCWQYEHNKLRSNNFTAIIGYLQLLLNEKDPNNKDLLNAWQKIRAYAKEHGPKGDSLKIFHAYTLERIAEILKKPLEDSLESRGNTQIHERAPLIPNQDSEDIQEQRNQLEKYIEEHYKRFSNTDPIHNKERLDDLTEAIGALGFLKKSLGTETDSFKEKMGMLIHVYFSLPINEQLRFVETLSDWFVDEYKKTVQYTSQ
ncbi:MAG: hypothetical protein HZA35_03425 [Parcubacteria group bacterium]|nr:hypothetical protein [Parcubacteria group bacterium]